MRAPIVWECVRLWASRSLSHYTVLPDPFWLPMTGLIFHVDEWKGLCYHGPAAVSIFAPRMEQRGHFIVIWGPPGAPTKPRGCALGFQWHGQSGGKANVPAGWQVPPFLSPSPAPGSVAGITTIARPELTPSIEVSEDSRGRSPHWLLDRMLFRVVTNGIVLTHSAVHKQHFQRWPTSPPRWTHSAAAVPFPLFYG